MHWLEMLPMYGAKYPKRNAPVAERKEQSLKRLACLML
jgi:hypothetical protein